MILQKKNMKKRNFEQTEKFHLPLKFAHNAVTEMWRFLITLLISPFLHTKPRAAVRDKRSRRFEPPLGSVIKAVSVSRSEKSVSFHVAGAAEGHEVRFLVSSAIRNRHFVVYLLGGFEDATLQTFLAQGMLSNVAVTDSFPRSAVAFLCFGVTAIVVVFPCVRTFVRRAVKLTVIGKVGTAGHTARSFRSCRHWFTSSSA